MIIMTCSACPLCNHSFCTALQSSKCIDHFMSAGKKWGKFHYWVKHSFKAVNIALVLPSFRVTEGSEFFEVWNCWFETVESSGRTFFYLCWRLSVFIWGSVQFGNGFHWTSRALKKYRTLKHRVAPARGTMNSHSAALSSRVTGLLLTGRFVTTESRSRL